jgi:hypothetical protein
MGVSGLPDMAESTKDVHQGGLDTSKRPGEASIDVKGIIGRDPETDRANHQYTSIRWVP